MRIAEALLILLLLTGYSAPGQAELQGEIRFQPAREGAAWVGQEVELQLELWSDGYSFGQQSFLLPEVSGGFLLQAGSATLKLSERRGGVQWQGLRYTVLFYPQRAGRLDIPAFDVRFTSSAGFGTEPTRFEFSTAPMVVEARLPPGADGGGLLVTTTSFVMEASWRPEAEDDGVVSLRVGDALTLTVERRALDVPGMVFSPLPAPKVDGLGVYPGSPRVNDRVNRGELTGMRSDSVTFVCEREGTFSLPETRFQWWDPERQVLEEAVIPARVLEVAANPAWSAGDGGSAAGRPITVGWPWVVLALALPALGMMFGRRVVGALNRANRQRRLRRRAGEPWAFAQAKSACEKDKPAQAYNAINTWLGRVGGAAGKTLLGLAEERGDAALAREAEALQAAVVAGSANEWCGRKLAELLVQLRQGFEVHEHRAGDLQALNPSVVRNS